MSRLARSVLLRHGVLLSLVQIVCMLLVYRLQAEDERPNIILFVSDDQGWNGTSVQMDPSVLGSRSDYYQTPNLESLAARGMRFSRAYSAAPLCQPTRASIQTGMSPAQLQYTDNFEANRLTQQRFLSNYNGFPLTPPIPVGLTGQETTIARWLEQNRPDYVSAHVGKWHMRNSTETDAVNMGFDVAIDSFGVGQSVDPWGIFTLTNMAVDFMEDRVASAEPFFLQLSHRAVHTPIRARPESIEMFDALPRGTTHRSASFAAMTYDLDASLGGVLDAVRELGIEDNTYIIYVSDNGSWIPESRPDPLGGGKNYLQEGGIRVPMVVAGPGIEPGSFSRVPVVTTDLLSTISDLVGIDAPLPDQVEGASLAPLLMNDGQLPNDMENLVRDFGPRGELFFHSPNNFAASAANRIPPMSAVVLDDWKLIKLWGENGQPDAVFLTKLDENIPEPRILVPGSPLNRAHQFPDVAADLDAALMQWLEGIDASLPYDVQKDVVLQWNAEAAGPHPDAWRSTNDVGYVLRETWSLANGESTPELVATHAYQPGLTRQAFSFDGNDRMTRKYFHVSDSIDRRNTPNSGTPDLDRSATFEFWLRLDSLSGEQVLFESGSSNQGLSITLGDGNGDGVHDEVRLRALGDDGKFLATTARLNEFSDPTRDFVQLVAVVNDADDDRYAELYVNGARFARVDGLLGPEGSIHWDATDTAGLGGVAGAGLGGNFGEGDRPFAPNGLRGDVAVMRFLNQAINSDDVRTHYNSALERVDLGIEATGSAAAVPLERPSDVSEGAFESDTEIFVMQERTDVLDEPLTLDFALASLENNTLAAGTEFTSYLVHLDPVGGPSSLQSAEADITFATPILGVLLEPGSLAGTDATLGSIGRYEVESQRRPGFFAPGPDGRSATILLSALGDAVAQMRVITEAVYLLEGDFNGDLRVDQGDLDLVLLNWGQDGTIPPSGWITNLPGGQIGQQQLDDLLLNWGNRRIRPIGTAATVPEPSGLALAGMLFTLVFVVGGIRRCKKRELK